MNRQKHLVIDRLEQQGKVETQHALLWTASEATNSDTRGAIEKNQQLSIA
jgi:hypothetical protein